MLNKLFFNMLFYFSVYDIYLKCFYYFQPKPDMLQLKQPCYVSDIGFFNNNKAVVTHRHGVVIIHF